MNYEKEVENLNIGSETWKPGVGVHEFVILTEPEETEFVDDKTGDKTPQIKMLVEVNGKQLVWYVGKGKTTQSAYGQLMVIGKFYKTLAGRKLELIVQESKDRNGDLKKSYMFPQSAKITQAEKENNDKLQGTEEKPETVQL